MNNKGQSLVTFVLIMPIVFLLVVMVYDIGRMVLLKNELNDINKIAINYGLDNINNENVVSNIELLINKNKKNIDYISVYIKDDKLYIEIEDSISSKVNMKNIFTVKSSYVGYMEDDKKVIERSR